MAAEKEERKDYEYYRQLLRERGEELSVEELLNLKYEISTAGFTKSQVSSLISGYLGALLTNLTNYKDRGVTEAGMAIGRFVKANKIDEDLAMLLSDYLTVEAPTNIYGSGATFSRYVVPGFISFIEFLYERKRKKLTVSSLSAKELSKTEITMFLLSKSGKEKTRETYRKILNKFRGWLDEVFAEQGLPLRAFTRVKPREESKALEVAIESRHGRVLTAKEINTVLGTVRGMKYPANETYSIFFRLMTVTGLRPVHTLVLTPTDIETAVVTDTDDALGRMFYKIRFWDLVKKAKEAEKGWIHGKLPPDYIYLPTSLMKLIEEYIVQQDISAHESIISISLNTIENAIKGGGRTVGLRKKTGITDLTPTCFRDTWASVIYVCSGAQSEAVMEAGGWRESKTVLKHYRTHIMPLQALTLLKEFEIRLPPAYGDAVKTIEAGMKPKTELEQQRELNAVEDTIIAMAEKMGMMDVVVALKKHKEGGGK